MDRDDLLTLQRRYAIRLTSTNHREAYQLATSATLDVPRLIAVTEQALEERDAALAERDVLKAELARVQAQLALGSRPMLDEPSSARTSWSWLNPWRRKPNVPTA
jgi:anti-sigma-K factor RskA